MADGTDVRDVREPAPEAAGIEGLPRTLSISDAARRCGVHRNTVRRYLDAGKFPGAFREDERSPWQIPVRDLREAGLNVRAASSAEAWAPESWSRADLAIQLEELQRKVREMTHRAEVAEALLSERDRRIEDLVRAVAVLGRSRSPGESSSGNQAG
jgi:predicted site-specific integrase-resolvase